MRWMIFPLLLASACEPMRESGQNCAVADEIACSTSPAPNIYLRCDQIGSDANAIRKWRGFGTCNTATCSPTETSDRVLCGEVTVAVESTTCAHNGDMACTSD